MGDVGIQTWESVKGIVMDCGACEQRNSGKCSLRQMETRRRDLCFQVETLRHVLCDLKDLTMKRFIIIRDGDKLLLPSEDVGKLERCLFFPSFCAAFNVTLKA